MLNRILLLGAAAVLAVSLWFALSEPAQDAAPGASLLAVPMQPTPVVAIAAPNPPPEADAPPPDVGAVEPEVVEPPPPSDWRAPWDDVPLDDTGHSMVNPRHAATFNRALGTAAKEAVRRCIAGRPRQVAQLVSMVLFVEARPGGYDIVGAEATAEDLDMYTTRCLEQAFSKRIDVDDSDAAAGQRYKLAYPLALPGAQPPEEPLDEGPSEPFTPDVDDVEVDGPSDVIIEE